MLVLNCFWGLYVLFWPSWIGVNFSTSHVFYQYHFPHRCRFVSLLHGKHTGPPPRTRTPQGKQGDCLSGPPRRRMAPRRRSPRRRRTIRHGAAVPQRSLPRGTSLNAERLDAAPCYVSPSRIPRIHGTCRIIDLGASSSRVLG